MNSAPFELSSVLASGPPDPTSGPKVPFLSFIVPTRDQAGGLRPLYDAIRQQAEVLAEDWEILFVDRGSGEATRSVLDDLSDRDPKHVCSDCAEQVRSHSDALAVGYQKARGHFIFTVEPEEDDDPRELPSFLARIRNDMQPAGEQGDRWRKILPRGVLRRSRPRPALFVGASAA